VHHTKLRTPNLGDAGLYLYVNDLAAYMKVSLIPTSFSLPTVTLPPCWLRVNCHSFGPHRSASERKPNFLSTYPLANQILPLQKIVDAGGKKASEVVPEGMGLLQHFEDTEGNYFGLYSAESNDPK